MTFSSATNANTNTKHNSISVIHDYNKKTGHEMIGHIQLKDTNSFKLYIIYKFQSSMIGPLMIEEKKTDFLLIKKRWLSQYKWSDDRPIQKYGNRGITIPLALYEHIALLKNTCGNELVICIMNEGIGSYYTINFDIMQRFAKKHYTIFIDPWGEEVIGLPYTLFRRI